jgi:phytol kinase
MLNSALLALAITFGAALLWLRLNDFAAHRGWVSSPVSRKIIHIGTGPLFVLCWLLFPNTPAARYLAALVPLLITAQFALVGSGLWNDPAAVQAMSRSGDRREILRGPLYYGIIFVVVTLLYWLASPIGIVALMMVCGGDGLADIIGRRYGRVKLPWNAAKSWAGSLGFFLGSWLLTVFILAVYLAAGVFPAPVGAYLLPVTLIALACTLVESISPPDVDNLTIAVTALALGHVFFH